MEGSAWDGGVKEGRQFERHFGMKSALTDGKSDEDAACANTYIFLSYILSPFVFYIA